MAQAVVAYIYEYEYEYEYEYTITTTSLNRGEMHAALIGAGAGACLVDFFFLIFEYLTVVYALLF